MVRSLFILSCLLVIPVLIVSAADEPQSTDATRLTLWASTDPAEDGEVRKINPVKLIKFINKYRDQFTNSSSDVIGSSIFLASNGEESGTNGVNWGIVFAKIAFFGSADEKIHGLPSLVAWAMRNTGSGTSNPSIDRETFIEFIFYHKTGLLKLITAGNVDGLVTYLDDTKAESGTKKLDWKSIIVDLKDNHQLFKYPCGFLGLKLCDRTKSS